MGYEDICGAVEVARVIYYDGSRLLATCYTTLPLFDVKFELR